MDASRVQEHFRPLLDHCPAPVIVTDRRAATILATNSLAGITPEVPFTQIFDAESRMRIVSSDLPIDHTDFITLQRIDRPGPPKVHRVRCEDGPCGFVYVLVEVSPPSSRSVAEHAQPQSGRDSMRQQELRFRALADSVPVGIFLTNPDGRVMYVNELWSKITGLSFNDAVLRGWMGAIHVDDRARVLLAWNRFLDHLGPFEAEFCCGTGDDSAWVVARAATFTNEKGERAGFLGTLMDVTSRREAEERLKTSEARYRSIFENVIDVYYETSLSGEILEVSPSIENLGGYTRSELLGRQMLGFYADGSARNRLIEHLLTTGGLYDYEIELRDKEGKPAACSISCKLERNENGEPVKIIGSMRDISRRKAVEEMLRLERVNLELIAKDVELPKILDSIVRSAESQAPDMLCSILLTDQGGKCLRLGAAPSLPDEYNRSVDGIAIGPDVGSCGTAAAIRQRVITEDIATDPKWEPFRSLALAHGLRACWSQPILAPSGCVGTFAMYYKRPGKPTPEHLQLIDAATQLAAVAIDRARAEQEQRNLEMQVRQAQKLESLGVLAGGIAHDFNNLLTGILGYASLASHALRDGSSPALRHVCEIEKVAQRAAGLTKQMLAYSGKGRFLVMPLDLSQSVEELARLLEISITKKARLRYRFERNIPLVEADPAQVQQVVMNLITNASEALGDRQGDITITTGTVDASPEYLAESSPESDLPAGKYVYVDVADTGCGMDQETMSRIFDPFFTTKFTGRGLGLSAVLGIMRGHRGTIKVESVVGSGTTVRLLFPALPTRAESDNIETLTTPVIRRDEWTGTGTILVVDDESTIRSLATALLAGDGYEVFTAIDGEQALEVYHRHRTEIDAVLLDLTMPIKDGVETLRELRAIGSEVPVILSSGYNEQEVMQRITDDEFQGFVQKPYSRDGLLSVLRSALAAR